MGDPSKGGLLTLLSMHCHYPWDDMGSVSSSQLFEKLAGDLQGLFLQSRADETFSGDGFQFFLVDDFWRLISPFDHVHVKVNVTDSVGIELDRGVDIAILPFELSSFCKITMPQRPGALDHLGDSIISGFNLKVEPVIAASLELSPQGEPALSKRDDLPLSKLQGPLLGFDVFKVDPPVFFQGLVEKPIHDFTLQPELSVGCFFDFPLDEVYIVRANDPQPMVVLHGG